MWKPGSAEWCLAMSEGGRAAAPQQLVMPRACGHPVRRGFSILSLASLEYWITRMRG